MHVAALFCFVLAMIFYLFASSAVGLGLGLFGVLFEIAAWIILFSAHDRKRTLANSRATPSRHG